EARVAGPVSGGAMSPQTVLGHRDDWRVSRRLLPRPAELGAMAPPAPALGSSLEVKTIGSAEIRDAVAADRRTISLGAALPADRRPRNSGTRSQLTDEPDHSGTRPRLTEEPARSGTRSRLTEEPDR